MKWNKVQLMIYGDNLDQISASFNSPDLKISTIHHIENKSYAFIDVEVSPNLKPGKYDLTFEKNGIKKTVQYSILKRENPEGKYKGFNSTDLIYLITPDRFSNGDSKNDNIEGMKEGLERKDPYGRHGGDILGISNHLDYLQEMGVSSLWINPLVENSGLQSYHGYAVTDLYKIDPRFGTNDLYKKLADDIHKRKMKLIMDHVNNHIGINHPWIQNLPTADWLNGTVKTHLRATHAKEALTDIYADEKIKDTEVKGWFSNYMPDMNQRNQYVKNYLIQNTLWWIEFTGLDGIREDTYPYIYQDFASDWNKAIMTEYPKFNIVGEVWIQNPVYLAPYQKDSFFPNNLNTNLPSITDFGLYQAFRDMISQKNIWPVYECLTKDFLYPHPENLVTFLDNHDIQRIMKNLDEDDDQFRFVMKLFIMMRGIPQLFYGTEIGMIGANDHGRLRMDFPGGFPGDSRDAFTEKGRTDDENSYFNFTKDLISLRKNHPAISTGKTIQFPPENNIYAFFKVTDKEKLLIIANYNSGGSKYLKSAKFDHLLESATMLRNVETGEEIPYSKNMEIELNGMNVWVFEVK